jgi:isoleucyl-tRNA synthetase
MVREEVSKELEKLRVTGAIGSSLDAEIEIYANDDFKSSLDTIEDELRFVLITSSARVCDAGKRPDDAVASELDGLWLKVLPSKHVKCIRCWHHREDVGNNSDHPEICGRCIDNIEGAGEQRQYC